MSEQSHRSDPRILSRRTLSRDHPRLPHLLRAGMSVLDVGCGTGAITAGIAGMVGPTGSALGMDRDECLLALARNEHSNIANLSFASGDLLSLRLENSFEIVTAARTLQWISRPELAIARMKHAAKPGGHIVALDYDHENNSWDPAPPAEFRQFYEAFLEWRKANSWSNLMADCLPGIFQAEGISEIDVHVDDEIARRGDPDFFDRATIWSHVTQSLGPQLVADGFLTEIQRFEAEHYYQDWVQNDLLEQTLQMRTVVGKIPEDRSCTS